MNSLPSADALQADLQRLEAQARATATKARSRGDIRKADKFAAIARAYRVCRERAAKHLGAAGA